VDAEQPKRRGRPRKADPAPTEPAETAIEPQQEQTASPGAQVEGILGAVAKAETAAAIDAIIEANAKDIEGLPRSEREQIAESAEQRKVEIALDGKTAEPAQPTAVEQPVEVKAAEPAVEAAEDIFGLDDAPGEPVYPKVTVEQARTALKDLVAAYGPTRNAEANAAGREILRQCGTEKFGGLQEENYGKFHHLVTTKLAEIKVAA
jgi:hypothetical protein